MNRNLFLLLFLGIMHIARGQTTGELRYWFDDDYSSVLTVADAVGNHSIDVSSLADGIHILYSMVVDENGQATPVVSHAFIKPYSTSEVSVTSCRYWFDNDTEHVVTTAYSNEAVMLDVSTLTNGLHFLYIQADGTMQTPVVSRMFAVIPEMSVEGKTNAELVINGQVLQEAEVPENGGTIDWNVDVSSLPNGLLTAYVTLYSEENVALSTYSSVFWKIPTGRKDIVGYEYWVNDGEALGRVELQEPVENYTLQTLLPVTTHPIRSSCFAFRVEEGQPYIYAKNDIRIRFHDDMNRFYDVEEKFVDEKVKQAVTDVELLESGVQVTTACPGENSIKWYKVEAERGDSLQFRLDHAATIQLFSPSGKEVYNTYGAKSVDWGGCHAEETGTFYVAIHNVTAQHCDILGVEYYRIDKYALLSYTPHAMGVLPSVQVMNINGNGFDNLKTAKLVGNNNTIIADSIIANGKADAQIVFMFQGNETISKYDLVLEYQNNDEVREIIRPEAILLEEPDFGDLLVDISSSHTTGSPYPVSIKITNTSNLTYSHIPFYMAYDNYKDIYEMKYMNFVIGADKELVDSGLVFIHEVKNFKNTGDSAIMIPAVIPLLLPGESQTFILGFKAGNHARYNVYAWTGTPWSLYATETMNAIHTMANSGGNSGGGNSGGGNSGGGNSGGGNSGGGNSGGGNSGGGNSGGATGGGHIIRLPSSGNNGNVDGNVMTSCLPDPCGYAGVVGKWIHECTCATGRNLALTLSSIFNALHMRSNRAQREQLLNNEWDYEHAYEQYPDYYLPHPNDLFNNWLNHCIPYPGALGKVMSALNAFQNTFGSDPCPQPNNHPVTQFNPNDPNDIIGYTAESGSKYMRSEISSVGYTIEFENDPEVATAAAHTIVVTDTLDVSRFSLSSFAARRVKIGDKVMELDCEKDFVKTMDLRPSVEVIAQVSLEYDEINGIAKWTIESLDPMSMEPTTNAFQGALPVNVNGNGIGELAFDIKLKNGLTNGDEVNNRAGIVFDQEDVIMTPTWTNIIDTTPPQSRVANVTKKNDTTLSINVEAVDALSGVRKYNIYCQRNLNTDWERIGVNVPVDSVMEIALEEGVNYRFYAVATDMAGNIEQKTARREFKFNNGGQELGDVNSDGNVDTQDAIKVIQYYLGKNPTGFNLSAADVNGDGNVDTQDTIQIIKIYLNKQ